VRSFAGHPLTCLCPECSEWQRLREQHITHDAPTTTLPEHTVALRELVDIPHTAQPHYVIGEDWSDD
jgi:hypothetical protein